MTALEQPGTQSRHSFLVRRIAAETDGVRRWTLSQVFFATGSVAIPLGLVFLALGYWGVAHTTLVFDQLPYLASGGLVGLGLIILGGFLYFGHWQVLAAEERRAESRRQAERDQQLLASLDRVHEALQALAAPSSRRDRAPGRTSAP
ncbi:MAG: hypothetical protein JWL79_3197 [Frankiales bacterium]|nr:hypothetical protein [Frankiales bacterium]